MKRIDDNTILARVLQNVRSVSHPSSQSPRANSFATVGGTRHCARSGALAHIELSTVAFQFDSGVNKSPEIPSLSAREAAGTIREISGACRDGHKSTTGITQRWSKAKLPINQFYPTRTVIRARPERIKADAAQWLYSIANHGSQMRNQSRYT